ncbi:MAG TPA: hypothetical protein VD813_11090 [Pseudonocardia sp.]|nr:hypothetical protein [Pseudonocardia sp.]
MIGTGGTGTEAQARIRALADELGRAGWSWSPPGGVTGRYILRANTEHPPVASPNPVLQALAVVVAFAATLGIWLFGVVALMSWIF